MMWNSTALKSIFVLTNIAPIGLCLNTAEAAERGGRKRLADQPDAANRLYTVHCAKCHSDDYSGKVYRQLGKSIPDFAAGTWQTSRTDSQILASIRDGKGDKMPPFEERLSEDQRRDLVALIRQVNPVRPAP